MVGSGCVRTEEGGQETHPLEKGDTPVQGSYYDSVRSSRGSYVEVPENARGRRLP
jgi:hypothetical protein